MKHNFESKVGGFSYETGHTNYSECSVCGIQTETYSHGDFSSMEEEEDRFNEEFDCEEFES